MKVRFEFEIDSHRSMDLDPSDFEGCFSLEELRDELLEYPDAGWRVSVNKDDLQAFWAAIPRSTEPAKLEDRDVAGGGTDGR